MMTTIKSRAAAFVLAVCLLPCLGPTCQDVYLGLEDSNYTDNTVPSDASFWVQMYMPAPEDVFSYRVGLSWDPNYLTYLSHESPDFDPNEPNQYVWPGALNDEDPNDAGQLANVTGTMLGDDDNARNDPCLVLLRVQFHAVKPTEPNEPTTIEGIGEGLGVLSGPHGKHLQPKEKPTLSLTITGQ